MMMRPESEDSLLTLLRAATWPQQRAGRNLRIPQLINSPAKNFVTLKSLNSNLAAAAGRQELAKITQLKNSPVENYHFTSSSFTSTFVRPL